MSTQVLSQKPAVSQQATQLVGRPLKRKEDRKILTGKTHYVDDLKLPEMVHGAVFRSSYAHALIKSIDVSRASTMKGVKLILTARDISKAAAPLMQFSSENGITIKQTVLAEDEVRYYGEPVAFVVADSKYEAEDALEAITVEYEPLDAIIDPEEAIKENSAKSHTGMKTNIALVDKVEFGNVDEAFTRAANIVKLNLVNQRLAPSPLEPRGCLAYFDGGLGVLNLWISSQGPYQTRSQLAEILGFPENMMRVVAPDVGGGFGAKIGSYPEDALVCIAAMKLDRPVKWLESRSENLSSMTHGRGQIQHVELASNEKGRILGLKVRLIGDAGAYANEESSDATFTLRMCPGQYIVPAYHGEAIIALTNKVPHSAYRGASRPEAIYLIERAIDELSRMLGIDPTEVRLRNYVPKEDFPFKNAAGLEYDTGDYSMNLKRALSICQYESLLEEQKRARQEGRLLGIGIASYVEICGFGPDFPETAAISVNDSGRVTVIAGTSPHGQGHETPFAQIVADKLGISVEDISVTYGDTATLPWGTFTAGSRSAALGGSAVYMCAEKIRDKMAKIAAKALDVGEDELVFKDGIIASKVNTEKKMPFTEVSSFAYKPKKLPSGMEPVLYAFSSFVPSSFVYPFGTHIAQVEVDRETGKTKILRYTAVDDCGKVLNPMIVEGQIHGGVAQGLGQAMLEDVVYDQSGQLLSVSFMDYQIPMAEDIPVLQSFRTETPALANPLGLKGIGEAGTIAATPTLMNAVRDALSPFSVRVEKMPVSMGYVKELIGTTK